MSLPDLQQRTMRRPWPAFFGLCLVFFVLAFGAILFSREALNVAALWPANAVALVALLRFSADRWTDRAILAALFAGLVPANLAGGSAPITALGLPALNVVEVALSLMFARRFCGGAASAHSFKPCLRFLLVVGLVIPAFAACIAAAFFFVLEESSLRVVFRTWFFADALGIMLLTPLGLLLRRRDFLALKSARIAKETGLVLGLVALTAVLIFAQSVRPLIFLLHPVLILAAFRIGVLGAAGGIIVVAAIGLPLTALGYGPTLFVPATTPERMVMIQGVIAITALSILPVATLIHERRQMAVQLLRARARAEEESAAKSRFIAHVNHEIGNALNAVLGFGDLLMTGFAGPLTDRQRHYFSLMVQSATHLQALVNDIRDSASAEAGALALNPTTVDVGDIVRSVAHLHAAQASPRGINLAVSLPQGEPVLIVADPMRLRQVLSNLFSNAIKYGAENDRVTIDVSREVHSAVRITVTDHGRGIPRARQHELFKPFSRLGAELSAVSGTGIGLALAKTLTELQGGTIDFASEPGQETSFWIEFPAAPAEAKIPLMLA